MNTLIRGLTDVDTIAKYAIGTRKEDDDGNIFVYLQGIISTVAGDWVTYYITSTAAAVTARLVAGAKGLVAIAMAAIGADQFGWYQISGHNAIARAVNDTIQLTVTDATDADVDAFIASPAGELYVAKDSAIVVGDIFKVAGTGDLTDNALATAKGGAVAANDLFKVTKITEGATVAYVGVHIVAGLAVYSGVAGEVMTPGADSGDLIVGAVVSVTEASGKIGVSLAYPYAHNEAM